MSAWSGGVVMAQRFGGKYSPQPRDRPASRARPVPAERKAARGSGAPTVLFLTAFLFLFPAFGDGPREMLLGLAAGGLLILSAWLTREGLLRRGGLQRPQGRPPPGLSAQDCSARS